MKFCDKLPKLRKEKNYSQEQLAERLNVSRQAVSKWESGSSYPDMEKMIEICKNLDCTLDELLDDGVINSNKMKKEDLDVKNIFDSFLKLISKIYNMFIAMTFKQKVKCFFEISFICFILFIIIMILLNLFNYILADLFYSSFVSDILMFLRPIIILFLLLISFIIVSHLFKIRYLDYFITVEDINVKNKIIEKEVEPTLINKKKERIIIRDPKHSTNTLFVLIKKIFNIIISITSFFILIPCAFTMFSFIIMLLLSIYYIHVNIIFMFISIFIIGLILISYVFTHIFYNTMFIKKINLKLTFLLFIISIILAGSGIGLTIGHGLNMNHITYEQSFKSVEVSLDSLEYIIELYHRYDSNIFYSQGIKIQFIIDNNQENAYIEAFGHGNINLDSTYLEPYKIFNNDFNYYYDLIISNLKNNTLITTDEYYHQETLTIYISEDNLNQLKNVVD